MERLWMKLFNIKIRSETTNDDNKRHWLKKGKGVFREGIVVDPKFKKVSASQQLESIKELEQVEKVYSFDLTKSKMRAVKVDLGWAGVYRVHILANPSAKRLDNHKGHEDNPFLSMAGRQSMICMGTARSIYSKAWKRNDYYQCLKIIMTILSCKKDHGGYHRWRECK
jgi:hypothetical protein